MLCVFYSLSLSAAGGAQEAARGPGGPAIRSPKARRALTPQPPKEKEDAKAALVSPKAKTKAAFATVAKQPAMVEASTPPRLSPIPLKREVVREEEDDQGEFSAAGGVEEEPERQWDTPTSPPRRTVGQRYRNSLLGGGSASLLAGLADNGAGGPQEDSSSEEERAEAAPEAEAEAEAEESKALQLKQLEGLDEEDFFDTFAPPPEQVSQDFVPSQHQ